MSPNLLIIPRFGIRAPIIEVAKTEEVIFQEALQQGVVHYPGTANIGEPGNAYIFGHSSDYVWAKGDYKTVFALLPEIKTGDLVYASNTKGQRFTYKVIEKVIVSPGDTKWLDQKNYEEKFLTLQTSYPVGTALRRFIVIGQLEE